MQSILRCEVAKALDAAHRKGRDWRLGHNSDTDGWLLRKDIHALYDAALLDILPEGTILISGDLYLQKHYAAFHQTKIQRSLLGA